MITERPSKSMSVEILHAEVHVLPRMDASQERDPFADLIEMMPLVAVVFSTQRYVFEDPRGPDGNQSQISSAKTAFIVGKLRLNRTMALDRILFIAFISRTLKRLSARRRACPTILESLRNYDKCD